MTWAILGPRLTGSVLRGGPDRSRDRLSRVNMRPEIRNCVLGFDKALLWGPPSQAFHKTLLTQGMSQSTRLDWVDTKKLGCGRMCVLNVPEDGAPTEGCR